MLTRVPIPTCADGGNGVQLGVQVLGAAAIAVTTLALNTIGFGLLRWLGCLRVPKQVGLPASLHSHTPLLGTLLPICCLLYCRQPTSALRSLSGEMFSV